MRKLRNVRDIYKSLANFSVMYNGVCTVHQKQNKYSHRVTPSRVLYVLCVTRVNKIIE